MKPNWSVFSQIDQLGLSKGERERSLDPFLRFLRDHPTPLGDALLEPSREPWQKVDAARFESLVLQHVPARQVADFLSIARSAAHYWSVSRGKVVRLPRYYVPQSQYHYAFGTDYAAAAARYRGWRTRLSDWLQKLAASAPAEIEHRRLILSALMTSAMLHGGAFGVRALAAIVRSIREKPNRTFAIGDRVHIELLQSWYGVAEAETRMWVPDALTATLWNRIEAEDVEDILRATGKRTQRSPSDLLLYRRLGGLIRRACCGYRDKELGGIGTLRQCCRAVAHANLRPVLVRYADCEISSNSLPREQLRRLFPQGELIQWTMPKASVRISNSPDRGMADPRPSLPPAPEWMAELLQAAKSRTPRAALEGIAASGKVPAAARRLATFGVSLLSSTSYSGKRLNSREVSAALEILGRSLGPIMDHQDLAKLDMPTALNLYIQTIEEQPPARRLKLIKWICAFDLFLRARIRPRPALPNYQLPWPSSHVASVDVGLITHEEYQEILQEIDRRWNPRDSPERRRMVRFLVVLAFRCGLRAGEIRGLRISSVLLRGVPELILWPRKDSPLKTRNAKRRIPIGALLSNHELADLTAWYRRRVEVDHAGPEDFLLGLPEDGWKRIPKPVFHALNEFLRSLGFSGEHQTESGVHEHTLRHAFGGWLFTLLLFADMEQPPVLFPDLKTTQAWLNRGKDIRPAIFRQDRPTQKGPYLLAALAGHADFGTTAHSYIHLFPWVLAAFLDASGDMRPEQKLVQLASGLPPSTYRDWLNRGGVHHVPVRMLQSTHPLKPVTVQPESQGRASASSRRDLAESWLDHEWRSLRSSGTSSAKDVPALSREEKHVRAAYLRDLKRSDGTYRHAMEMAATSQRNSRKRKRLGCPARPAQQPETVPEFARIIQQLSTEDPELVRNATRIYAHHLQKRSFVRFNSPAESGRANRYIEFLLRSGFRVRDLEIVSGATAAHPKQKAQWKDRLAQPNLLIQYGDASRNFGSRSGLSVRPRAGDKEARTYHAAFRFVMAMAYIVFGPEPMPGSL